jgi:ubiquinone biosynthesis protein COQ9
MALPANLARTARNLVAGLQTSCGGSRGDTATDYNHYTKRMILSGVYGIDADGVFSTTKAPISPTPMPFWNAASTM